MINMRQARQLAKELGAQTFCDQYADQVTIHDADNICALNEGIVYASYGLDLDLLWIHGELHD